eukprot:NODE_598_length_6262_cov_0.141652.p2 type:complete len:481 gc:universal NODE_598_length_6262_cov_0.141652:540-1982(+)
MTRRLMQKLPFDLPQHFKDKWIIQNLPKYYKQSPKCSLFEKQSNLSKLPVPKLEQTLAKYLKSLEPLLSPKELARSIRIVNDFKDDPFALTLQTRLIEKSKGWLAEYWNNYAYLEWRDPCAGNVNFFYHFKDDLRNQVNRASCLIREFIGFRQLIINHELDPEVIKDDVLCSHMYNFLFNSTRVPLKPRDQVATYNHKQYSHVVVLYKHSFYKISTIINNVLLSSAEIEQQLNHIVLNHDGTLGLGIGALTSSHRDKWADIRDMLVGEGNLDVLETIQSAAFAVCLDDSEPVTLEECATTFLYGDLKNRWFDKSCQLIVCANGKAGVNNEHSMMDGTINTRLCDTVLSNMDRHDAGEQSNQTVPQPVQLNFKVNPKIVKAVQSSVEDFDKWSNPHNLSVLAYYGYGKEFIKDIKCSPDAYVQMGLQLAYFKLTGKVAPTYESATIRKYRYSRTETCRTVSNESKAFCVGMMDGSLNVLQK